MSEQNETDNKIQHLINLQTFVDKFRISKTDKSIKHSHTSMGSYMGSFNIPEDKLSTFYKYYKKAIKTGHIPSILETHLEQGPIIIDLDFKYTIKSDSSKRIYTNTEIENIISIYNQVILTYLSINEDDINIYILEKNTPKIITVNDTNNTTTYKDGIHIIYPYICANNRLQLFFREIVLHKIIEDKILDHLNLDNTIDDVFDKAVIERNNWLLYGSCKDTNPDHVYKLTKIYDVKIKILDMDEVDWFNLPTLLSIRKFKSEDHSEYTENFNMEKINNLYNEIIGKKTNNKPFALNTDIRKAKILCGMLSETRAKNYLNWIEVGFCLHNIDDSLLEDWIEFSKKSIQNFKMGECEKLWTTFKYEGLSIGSLYRWAKHDNYNAYTDFLLNEIDDIIKNSINNTSYCIASVFYEFNKYQYVCTSISKKKWYEYKDHRWTHMDEASSIVNKLNTELSDCYIKLGIAFGYKALHVDDEAKKNYLKKSRLAYDISQKLQKMAFKKEIIAELLHLYYNPKFMEKLDENRYLIGFENGVYDLEKGYFRNGRPEDYISMSTKCDYIKYDETNDKIKEVLNFFDHIQPDTEMKNYLLYKLSSFLEGVQRDQKFEIWTGTGANGKGRILKLLLDSFGDYGCTIPITLLTKPRSDSNSVTPALAMTKGKRCCAFQEPENDDKIYVGHMKNITGGDKLMARSLYSDPVEFYPQFKTILACNKLPDIPSADGGTWRRIRVVPFETKFVDNPKESNERQKINNIDDLITEWRSAFMSLLLEKYKNYRKYGIDEPAKVLIHTNEYQNISDIYMEFIRDSIISTTNTKEYITYDDIWEEFKAWYKRSNRPDNKKPPINDFKTEIEIRLGKPKRNRFIGFRYRTDEDEDDNNISMTDKVTDNLYLGCTEDSQYISGKKVKKNKNKNSLDSDMFDDTSIDQIFIKDK